MKARRHLAARHPTTMALIVIDMMNIWTMANGPKVRRAARAMLPALARMVQRARDAKAPVIYANDNFGRWRSNMPALVEQSRRSHPDSQAIVEAIAPVATDYVVLKPEHSAFYATPLEPLLKALHTRHVVLAGVSGDQCVLATAGDALLRDLDVTIPRDTIACATPLRTRAILRHFQQVMDLPTPLAQRIRWR